MASGEREREANLGLAIGLSIGSGLCTSIGGLAVFLEVISKQSQSRILSSALALSAGVMLYVSFIEIFGKAQQSIAKRYADGAALAITTICFFVGMAITAILELVVHHITHLIGAPHSHEPLDPPPGLTGERAAASAMARSSPVGEVRVVVNDDAARAGPFYDGASGAPGERAHERRGANGNGSTTLDALAGVLPAEREGSDGSRVDRTSVTSTALMTALAIALHNFPEGLATFIATLAQPSLGIALSVAIAVHNVPEGMAVAFPVYYASGSKRKGFLWATLSGLTEPIGGSLGARARLSLEARASVRRRPGSTRQLAVRSRAAGPGARAALCTARRADAPARPRHVVACTAPQDGCSCETISTISALASSSRWWAG